MHHDESIARPWAQAKPFSLAIRTIAAQSAQSAIITVRRIGALALDQHFLQRLA
jgi:hypothetical protein